MSDPRTAETPSDRSATAVATPPAPPAAPPATATAMHDPEPRRKHTGAWIAVVVAALAVLMLGGVVWLVIWSLHGGGTATNSPAVQSAFASAMKKAGVSASYPTAAPVDLTTVKATGSHHFSATFTGDEVSALLDTFSYSAETAGMQVSISRATIAFPAPGTIRLDGQINANGGSYAGAVVAPVTYSAGAVHSTGATTLSVEGIAVSAGQRATASGALVDYANSLLGAAPGLVIDTATITAGGVSVTGTAPDSIGYP